MNKNFLIKLATRGRPDWFKKTILNIHETISRDAPYVIIISADLNDASMNNSDIREFAEHYHHCEIRFGTSTTKIEAINANMNDVSGWDILINVSDDMQFIVANWDKRIEQLASEKWPHGDFFAHFNDGYVGEALSTMSIMDNKYYNRDKYIYHPSYKSFSADAEAMYVAQMRGRHYYFPEILFLHQHPTNRPAPNDETYRVNSLHTEHDTKNYFERLNRYFDVPESERTGGVPFKQHLGRVK